MDKGRKGPLKVSDSRLTCRYYVCLGPIEKGEAWPSEGCDESVFGKEANAAEVCRKKGWSKQGSER
jgi:hypothetical protein